MSRTGRLTRYDAGERFTHAASALTYLYLLLTGLAFWTPGLYWLAIVLGGGYVSRVMHPWVGLAFSAAVTVMYVTWRRDMKTAPEDVAWRKAMPHYMRNEDAQVPPAGRFNYGQKHLFWLMVAGALGLLLSGLVLWFVDAVPREFVVVRQVAVLVHAVAALMTIAGFIVHLYMGLLVVPGGFQAILHGEVSREWAEHHHPLWASKVGEADRPRD